MKLQFNPYVLEQFNDWYIWPTAFSPHEITKESLMRDYQMRRAELQHHFQTEMHNMQKDFQERLMEQQHQLQQDLLNASV